MLYFVDKICKMKALHFFYSSFFGDKSKEIVEKAILYIALFSFIIHLGVILIAPKFFPEWADASGFLANPISAIYTPFSFILIYEVYLLIYFLPQSFTTYVTKQYEIITLIIIRKLFKDLSVLELQSDWFQTRSDMQFTYDILASIVLFYLIYLFQKQGRRNIYISPIRQERINHFIVRKKWIAVILVPLFFILATSTLLGWLAEETMNFNDINNLFFDEFFTVLILVDVVLLLISFFYTDQFHKIIRNSGFVVSTILIRLSFTIDGLTSTLLIIGAVSFGLLIIWIHNKFDAQQETSI